MGGIDLSAINGAHQALLNIILSAGRTALTAATGITRGQVLFRADLEIGLAPAIALAAKARYRKQFVQCRLLAGRTFGQRCIGEFLQARKAMTALSAFVFVNWHGTN